ncbi:MAG: hypothetical protein ACETVX_02400 [bacterium]
MHFSPGHINNFLSPDPLEVKESLKGTVKLTIKNSATITQKLEAMATLTVFTLFLCCQSNIFVMGKLYVFLSVSP